MSTGAVTYFTQSTLLVEVKQLTEWFSELRSLGWVTDGVTEYFRVFALPNKANALGRQKAPILRHSALCRR